MKEKGFTLVELLAVIVILAVISLIATPIILNVIEKTKIGALESSVNGLVESANMYYANNTIKGETVSETIFDFEDGEQVSDKKLEYKGKVYNGKLILHANGEVAVCIDDEEHYAYKNKDDDEVVSGIGTCLYDGTTGDFSSNSSINDLRGKIVVATQIEESGDNALITIPEEGHYDGNSKISVPIETIKNEVSNLGVNLSLAGYLYRNSWGVTSIHSSNITSAASWDTTNMSYFTNNTDKAHKYLICIVTDGNGSLSTTFDIGMTLIGSATFNYPTSFYITNSVLASGDKITISLNKMEGVYIIQLD